MENNTAESLISQYWEKIGSIAEAVVLPKNRRSFYRPCEFADISLQDVDAQGAFLPTHESTEASAASAPVKQKKYYPIFMMGIFLIEVGLKYAVDNEDLAMNLAYDPHRRHEIWRFITIMFVHFNHFHLWSNVIFQLILGVLLEIVHGWKRIGIIYLSSVLGGSLFVTILNPKTYAVGASAGVYGLLFAHLSTIIINWNQMDKKCCRVFWLFAYVTFDIGVSVFMEVVVKRTSNTSHAGHLGGALTGLLMSTFVLKNFEKPTWEKRMKKICIGIVVALGIIIVVVNVTAWEWYAPTEFNFDYVNTYENYLIKLIAKSPENSQMRKICEIDEYCKERLEQYNFNGTLISST